MADYIRKPPHGREGDGIDVVSADYTYSAATREWGGGGYCWQHWSALPSYDGAHPVLGSWAVDGEPAGLGIRESDSLVTDMYARFAPHAAPDGGGAGGLARRAHRPHPGRDPCMIVALLSSLRYAAAYTSVGIALLVFGWFVLDLLTPGHLGHRIFTDRSTSAALVSAAGLVGLAAVVFTAIWTNAIIVASIV